MKKNNAPKNNAPENAPAPDLTDDLFEHEAKRRREDVIEACKRAIECMERFTAEARRELDATAAVLERAADLDPERLVGLPGKMLRASTWGAANASKELDTAMRMVAAYMYAIARSSSARRKALPPDCARPSHRSSPA